jgi:hypothetical protein
MITAPSIDNRRNVATTGSRNITTGLFELNQE